jgi:hypothetical protein
VLFTICREGLAKQIVMGPPTHPRDRSGGAEDRSSLTLLVWLAAGEYRNSDQFQLQERDNFRGI